MTEGKEILRVLEEIKNVSSTKQKQIILEENKDVPFLEKALHYGLSPKRKYFIKSINIEDNTNEPTKGIVDVFSALDQLSTGEFRGSKGVELLTELSQCLSNEDNELLRRFIAKKLKFNMGTTLINKVYKDLIEDTPYMGCKSYSLKYAEKLFASADEVVSEVKMDGQYINAHSIEGNVTFESRQGEENIFPGAAFEQELKTIDGDYIFNGELTIEGETNRHIANGVVRSLVDYYSKLESRSDKENATKLSKFIKERGDSPENFLGRLIFTVWDVITPEEYIAGFSSRPRKERLAKVEELTSNLEHVQVIEYRLVKSLDEALAHYSEVVQNGGEGTVIKDYTSPWKDGKPTYQLKVKVELTVDLEIIGFNYGTGKNEGIVSSLQVKSSDGIIVTNPGGMPEELMAEITADTDSFLGKIVEVKCYGISSNSKGGHALAHPSVLFIRNDKDKANSYEECMDVFNSQVYG